jgi:glycosyltransferase involved in cell wall biosynthesis
MIKFSLVVPTRDRVEELKFLLISLANQTVLDFELIIVDQNTDDRLVPILATFPYAEKVQHVKSAPTGASCARNIGLARASGEIIAFPDDDCWYPKDILENVTRWFKESPSYDILALTSRDETGRKTGNRWHVPHCDLTSINIFRTSAAYTFFIRANTEKYNIQFDEAIGPGSGTCFGASEDTDVLLSLMKQGARGRFHSAWYIGHPRKDMIAGQLGSERWRKYGHGMGRVLGKHSLLLLWFSFVILDFGRALVLILAGKRKPAALYASHGTGLIHSYFA